MKQDANQKRDTNQKSERLSSLLSLAFVILIAVFLIRLLTSDSQSSSVMSPGVITLTDNLLDIGSAALFASSLVCIFVAFMTRKESKKLAVFFVILALILIFISWSAINGISQVQIVPVSH